MCEPIETWMVMLQLSNSILPYSSCKVRSHRSRAVLGRHGTMDTRKKIIRRQVAAKRRLAGTTGRKRRVQKVAAKNPVLAAAMEKQKWKDLANLYPAAGVERQTVYRTRIGAFPRLGPDDQDCRRTECVASSQARVEHWPWTRHAAHCLWEHVLAPWAAIYNLEHQRQTHT